MSVWKSPLMPLAVACVFTLTAAKPIAVGPASLWRDPADIESRNLFYGPGGIDHVPHGTFVFVKEDLDGTNPKFVVRDQDGQKWKVKLGIEAAPETAASRIVWAAGYYAHEDYFVSVLHVQGMPARLHRGWKLVEPDGTVHNVRLKREDEKKLGNWEWRQNPFLGTREWNGLRTLMALINNWDLKDENNAIYQQGDRRIYMVSDLGASFGSSGRNWPPERSKGNLDYYQHSKLLRGITASMVSFRVPARPRYVYWLNPKECFRRIHLEWIGKNIPKDDARWMGRILARLSDRQIRDAFLSAGYSPQEAKEFAQVLEGRIVTLEDL